MGTAGENPEIDTLRERISDQSSKNTVKQNKKRLQEDINDNQSDSLEKLLVSEFKNLRGMIADFDFKLNSVAAQVNKVEINESWPSHKFDKKRDQHKYDALCEIGKELDLALDLQDTMNILNHVAEGFGWDLAAALPNTQNKLLKSKESLIEKAKALAEACKNKKRRTFSSEERTSQSYWRGNQCIQGTGVTLVVTQDIMQTHVHPTLVKAQVKKESLDLSQEAYDAIEPRSVYGKQLIALWNEFVAFCNCHKLNLCPAHSETVMMFLTWLNLLAKVPKLRWYIMAIGYHHRKLEVLDSTQKFNVQRLVRNLLKCAAEDKEAVWP
ncbi:17062_t:CDS:2, partial [Dentiscutata erythropus]